MKNEMKLVLKGSLIATAVAGMFVSGCTATTNATAGSGSEMVKCSGANSCKGKAACKTATHECAGQNSCKGKGWIKVSKSDCVAKGGKALMMKMK